MQRVAGAAHVTFPSLRDGIARFASNPLRPEGRRRARRAILALCLAAAALALIALAGVIWHRSTFVAPRATTIVSDRHGAFLAQLGDADEGYGYWPVAVIPDRVAAAILALEDHRFWNHPGVDPLAVARAVRSNWGRARHVSGASTLAMQVARMQHPQGRTYLAKLVEMATAMTMTARYGRAAVFRHYLRLVPFGQNSHGIAHAARWYFDKPVDDLSWAEIAFLSAIPQAPAAMNPSSEDGRQRAVERGRQALARLHAQHVVGDADYTHALDDLDRLAPVRHPPRPKDALHVALRLDAMLSEGPPVERLRSTLDLELQARAAKLARQRLNGLRAQGAEQVALIILDRASAEVLALVGSSAYGKADAGMIDYAGRPRSPGSTLKPFIYAQALERGDISPSTILLDDADNGTGIDNADRRFLGPLLPRQALGNSRNVPAAKLIRRSGLMQTHWFLERLGIHDGERPADRYGLTLAVGGMPTGLDRLVAAYDALANDGVLQPLKWYEGQALPPPQRVMSAQTAREITAFLADPMARLPSFARMSATEYPFPAAVKTGTSQGYRDAWVVAYSERYLVGVWMGRPDGRPMAGLSGATSAGLLAHDVLIALHPRQSDGLDDGEFRGPAGVPQASLCADTGLPATNACDHVLTEFVAPARPLDNGPGAAPWDAAPRVRLRIATPNDHAVFIRNPETPAGLAFLPLRLRSGSNAIQVTWYVDGKAFRLAMADDTVRWPVAAGRHVIEARTPYGEAVSPPVDVVVR